MQRAQILFLLNSLGVGGSERKSVNVAKFLSESGLPVGCLYMRRPDTLASQFPASVPVTFLDRRSRLSLRTLRQLLAAIRGDGPCVLVAVNVYPALYVAVVALLARRSVLKTVCLMNSASHERARDHLFHRLYLWALRRMDVVVYGSETQRRQWVSAGSPAWQRSCVIYNGVQLQSFQYAANVPEALAFREQHGIASDRFVFGSVGRLVSVKNYAVLIDALAQLRARKVDAQLLLVGDGPLRSALQQQASALGVSDRLTFTGEVQDVRPALAAMDVFVLPSTLETFSNAALEAMAMAKAVVMTNVGGAAEMVVHGREGLLVDPQVVTDGVVQCLLTLSSDKQRSVAMGEAARARIVTQFTDIAMFKRYLEVLGSGSVSPSLDS